MSLLATISIAGTLIIHDEPERAQDFILWYKGVAESASSGDGTPHATSGFWPSLGAKVHELLPGKESLLNEARLAIVMGLANAAAGDYAHVGCMLLPVERLLELELLQNRHVTETQQTHPSPGWVLPRRLFGPLHGRGVEAERSDASWAGSEDSLLRRSKFSKT